MDLQSYFQKPQHPIHLDLLVTVLLIPVSLARLVHPWAWSCSLSLLVVDDEFAFQKTIYANAATFQLRRQIEYLWRLKVQSTLAIFSGSCVYYYRVVGSPGCTCLYTIDMAMNWSTAFLNCPKTGGRLPEIYSFAENSKIFSAKVSLNRLQRVGGFSLKEQ